jgi:DNA-binding transcriptional regulator YiaG
VLPRQLALHISADRWHVEQVTELRSCRRQLSLSQAEFADMLGVPLNSFRTWDSGLRPTPGEIVEQAKIAAAEAVRDQQPLNLPDLATERNSSAWRSAYASTPRPRERDQGSPERQRAALLHAPVLEPRRRIDQFQHDLVNRQLGATETERLTRLQNRLSLIVYLEENLKALVSATESAPLDERLSSVVSSFVEALDFVLLTLEEALETGGGESLEVLTRITEDRGDFMERIRHDYLADEGSATSANRAVLLQVTSIFERIIWITQRLARVIDGEQRSKLTAVA